MTDNQELVPCVCGKLPTLIDIAGDIGFYKKYVCLSCDESEATRNAITAWNIRPTQPQGDTVSQEMLDAAVLAFAKANSDKRCPDHCVYEAVKAALESHPTQPQGDVLEFGDVLVEQRWGDRIQRVNIPNARLVRPAMPQMPQMPSEDSIIKALETAIDQYAGGEYTVGHEDSETKNGIARALLKHTKED